MPNVIHDAVLDNPETIRTNKTYQLANQIIHICLLVNDA